MNRRTEEHLRRARANARVQGIAAALAEVQRLHDNPVAATDVLAGFGLSMGDLAAAGVEGYDLDVIYSCQVEAPRT
ncbi:hypothetical protein [Ancylobacter sp. SL191]|uniref:hypothetical protein n=1 Tax=Ancylobacter sp. SL191 TaxID=2995166 RepID=UPI0022704E63|nr:hypothetical protein [Ancylobacter sp. SL191]WAC26312.1 hypothetical protein OU996_15000 [Ancylobacter sp. SL191]